MVFIIDVLSRRIGAWHASTSWTVDLVTGPLRMALWQRKREGYSVRATIFHSGPHKPVSDAEFAAAGWVD